MAKTHTVCLISDEATRAVALRRQGRRWEITARGSHDIRNPDSTLTDCHMAAVANGVQEALRQAETVTPRVTLIIPQQWCFTHVLAVSAKGAARSALAFEFEEFLPLPLEEVTCAFASHDDEHTLAVGVPTQPMVDLVRQLADRGIEVQHIVVDAIVAPQTQDSATGARQAVIVDRRWIRTTPTAEGTPTIAPTPPTTGAGSVVAAAVRDMFGDPTDGATSGDSANASGCRVFDLAGQYATEANDGVTDRDDGGTKVLKPDDAVASLAIGVAASPTTIDLRTGSLAGDRGAEHLQRLATQCLMLGIMAMMILCGGLLLARRNVGDLLTDVEAQRSVVYRETFDAPPPLGAALRLASERVKLEGLTRSQVAGETDGPAFDSSPLDVLREIVEGLPADVRVMLLDARLEERQLTLRGQTASHRSAERIVEVINAVAGLNAHPPRTTRLRDGGVEFSIVAVRGNGDG